MKASLHMGKGSAIHNDRTFDLDKADHIDQERTSKNITHIFSKDEAEKKMTFDEYERHYYKKNYSETLEKTNENYIKNRHPERVKTMDDWYKSNKPTEAIFQIGNEEEQVNEKYVFHAFKDALNEMKEKYPNFVPLNVAIHLDETTPHIHFRFVIEAHDKDGCLKPSKTKGLKEMGIERPDLSEPEGRFNNPMMTFTSEFRERFYQKIEEQGLNIDKEPHLDQKHLETINYKKKMAARDVKLLAETAKKLERQIEAYDSIIKQTETNFDRVREVAEKEAEIERLTNILKAHNISPEEPTHEREHHRSMRF